ncbi:MAG: ATP-dependent Clp protease ATP-binding subunit [Eubacteriales bacterium]|nr:ATP-dependent Clp protease ATP-binding subunit [Eubacteriales bacterium]
MPKCQICKVNEAVIILTRIEGEKRISEGICLECALKKNIGGLEEAFARSGITRENVGEIQSRINEMIDQMGGDQANFLLKSLMDSNFNINDALDGLKNLTTSLTGDGEEGLTNSMTAMGELMNAPTAREDKESRSPATDQLHPGRRSKEREPKKKFLNQFGTNLTLEAQQGRIDKIIGRQKELDRVVQILNRRTKNNPVLLGEPGVGKTAIAQGLALRIAEGQVPAKLLDKEVYQLDMTAMVAGTQFRGQFENRMKGVVEEAKRSGNVILVIDELHNIMGAGDAEGSMNAANILKPALAQGDISVIGATTLDEYRRFIEKDSALERRFQKVIVDEPSTEDALEILKGIKGYYEDHHQVHYSDETLASAVRLSARYIQDRFLPDKAIDLLDEAGSRVNLDNQDLITIQKEGDRLAEIKEELDELNDQLRDKLAEEDRLKVFEQQANLRSEEMRLSTELEKLQAGLKPVEISQEDIASVVEMWTGIPVKAITESEGDKLLRLEQRLHKRVIGQEAAVTALSKAIRRKRAGFGKKDKPASFLFVGPTGVGKTELAKALAEVLFEDESALVRLDMSEFMEAHTVSKLIGSPPGYVGYDDGGQLTEKIRRHPYSVILLDEIEKAHADVYNMLLQILDDGRLTDSHGRVVNFANTVIIMTSNAGTSLKGQGLGFGQNNDVSMKARVDSVLKDIFRPEFLNRIDDIVIFESLSKQDLRQIVSLMLKEVENSIQLAGYQLEVTPAAKDALSEQGYDPKFGARPLRKTIQKQIEDHLSDLLLQGKLDNKNGVKVGYRQDDFYFDIN